MHRLPNNHLKKISRFVLDFHSSKSFSCTRINTNLKKEWESLAQKQLKGKPLDSLDWQTSEVNNILI